MNGDYRTDLLSHKGGKETIERRFPHTILHDTGRGLQDLQALRVECNRYPYLVATSCTVGPFLFAQMRRKANGSFLTVTELADALVREDGISFLAAHGLVAAAVQATGREYSPERMVAEIERLAPETLGKKLRTHREGWLRALDPEYFVRIRSIAGGSAPEAVQPRSQTRRRNKPKRRNGSMRSGRCLKTILV